jgi:hypothetical protein
MVRGSRLHIYDIQITGETRIKTDGIVGMPSVASDKDLIGHDDWEGMPF